MWFAIRSGKFQSTRIALLIAVSRTYPQWRCLSCEPNIASETIIFCDKFDKKPQNHEKIMLLHSFERHAKVTFSSSAFFFESECGCQAIWKLCLAVGSLGSAVRREQKKIIEQNKEKNDSSSSFRGGEDGGLKSNFEVSFALIRNSSAVFVETFCAAASVCFVCAIVLKRICA